MRHSKPEHYHRSHNRPRWRGYIGCPAAERKSECTGLVLCVWILATAVWLLHRISLIHNSQTCCYDASQSKSPSWLCVEQGAGQGPGFTSFDIPMCSEHSYFDLLNASTHTTPFLTFYLGCFYQNHLSSLSWPCLRIAQHSSVLGHFLVYFILVFSRLFSK